MVSIVSVSHGRATEMCNRSARFGRLEGSLENWEVGDEQGRGRMEGEEGVKTYGRRQ